MTRSSELGSLPYTYDRADFAALAKLTRPRIVGWLFKLVWVLIVLVLVLIALAALLGATIDFKYLLLTLVLSGFAFLLNRFGPELAGAMQIWSARRNGILREQHFLIMPQAFRAESSRGITEINWSAVPRIEHQDERLFIFIAKRIAFIVPRRAFESDSDFEAFVASAWDCWNSRHRL